MPEWVTIENKRLKDAPSSVVTRKAYERVLKAKGFTLVKPAKKKETS